RAHGPRPGGVESSRNLAGESGQGLVDGIVDDLIDHVMQTRAIIGVADVHTGTLAHSVEALHNFDPLGPVALGTIGLFGELRAHGTWSRFGGFLLARSIHQLGPEITLKTTSEC